MTSDERFSRRSIVRCVGGAMAAGLLAGCAGPGGDDSETEPADGNESAVADSDRVENESGEAEHFDDRNQTEAEGDDIDGDQHQVPENESNATDESTEDEPAVSAEDNESDG